MNCALMTVFTILKGGKVLLGINNFVAEAVSCIELCLILNTIDNNLIIVTYSNSKLSHR